MKLLLIAALLALTACANENPNAPESGMIIVCAIDGQETYRSQKQSWWSYSDGVWRGGWSGLQYKPSYVESCHSEQVP